MLQSQIPELHDLTLLEQKHVSQTNYDYMTNNLHYTTCLFEIEFVLSYLHLCHPNNFFISSPPKFSVHMLTYPNISYKFRPM